MPVKLESECGSDEMLQAVDAAPVTERCPCPLCGSPESAESPYREGSVGVVRCLQCAAWYLSPRLPESELLEMYATGNYFDGNNGTGYDSYRRQERSLRATFARLIERMQRLGLSGDSVLDVGCGYGYFLREAARSFPHRFGTDFCPVAAETAAHCADHVWVGGAESIPPELRFDCITALHVIEHVYEPHAFLAQLKERLNPGGWLLLAAPDMGGFWRVCMGRRWPSFKYPEHVVFYDRNSLGGLMQSGGLTNVQPVPYPHAFPLADVCAKLRVPAPRRLETLNVWIPATTIALAGQFVPEDAA